MERADNQHVKATANLNLPITTYSCLEQSRTFQEHGTTSEEDFTQTRRCL